MKILEAKNLVAGYSDLDILHGISMYVEEREIVSIIGPNGCGKSTLMKTIFGLLAPRSGNILFKSEDISGLRPNSIVQKGMGYVPQERDVFPSLTVQENLEMGAFTMKHGVDSSLEAVCNLFPILREKKKHRVVTMSGGERRMVGIGRALMLSPQLLLLDEPSAGLAPRFQDIVLEQIVRINNTGTSIMIVEQNARKALNISHRGYVLDMGKNAFEGEGKSLLENQEVLKLYLGG